MYIPLHHRSHFRHHRDLMGGTTPGVEGEIFQRCVRFRYDIQPLDKIIKCPDEIDPLEYKV